MAHDAIQQIIALLEEAPATPATKNPATVGSGLKSVRARAEMLTARQRSNIAKAVAVKHWAKD